MRSGGYFRWSCYSLIEVGRTFVYQHGVYEKRRILQMIFLFLLAVVSLAAVFLWFWMNRHNWRELGYMLVGGYVWSPLFS